VSLPSTVVQCGACLRQPPPLAAVLAAVDYDYPWAHMVRDFKFHADIAWARSFARLLRSTPWVDPVLEAADWIVPMPLSHQRLLQRGFNQSAVLAGALETGSQRKLRHDVLVRIRDTAAQSKLPRSERYANVAHAFAVHPDWFTALRGKKVVLVDDVMTTGASLHAAAQALAQAGAAQTVALVFARTP
jgi:ComF family protein